MCSGEEKQEGDPEGPAAFCFLDGTVVMGAEKWEGLLGSSTRGSRITEMGPWAGSSPFPQPGRGRLPTCAVSLDNGHGQVQWKVCDRETWGTHVSSEASVDVGPVSSEAA